MDNFSRFLQNPSKDTYLALRKDIIDRPDFNYLDRGISQLEKLIKEGDHQKVRAFIPQLMPTHLLSPVTHLLIAESAKNAGEEEQAKQEFAMFSACLKAMNETGDGSLESPYAVILIADEYDILRSLEETSQKQSLIEDNGRKLDKHLTESGKEIYFDVSDSLAKNPLT